MADKKDNLFDLPVESAVIGSILKSPNLLFEVESFLEKEDFSKNNGKLFGAIKSLVIDKNIEKLDPITIVSYAKEIGDSEIEGKHDYIEALFERGLPKENFKKMAVRVKRLSLKRGLKGILKKVEAGILDDGVTVTDTLNNIESEIFNFGNFISNDKKIVKLGRNSMDLLNERANNPVDYIGFETDYRIYSRAIGGLFRRGTANLFVARSKCVSGDTSVTLSDGSILKISDMYNGFMKGKEFKIMNLDENKYKIKEDNVVNVIKSKKKKMYEVLCDNGMTIKATSDHLFLTQSGYKKLCEISELDYIATSKNIPINNTSSDIYWSKIKKIEETEIEDCYDITMKNDHNFIGNGFIVHNCGKSGMILNFAYDQAKRGIPTLYIDSELKEEDQKFRFNSLVAGVPIELLECGKWAFDKNLKQKVCDAQKKIEEMPLYFASIIGEELDVAIARIRDFLNRTVKRNKKMQYNDCAVFYDYFKITNENDITGNMQEYQKIGFMMQKLRDLAMLYDFPMMIAVQSNRSGLQDFTEAAISQSDRLNWLSTSMAVLAKKTEDEIAEFGEQLGTRKLYIPYCHHGKGLFPGDFIHLDDDYECFRISEIKLNSTVKMNVNKQLEENKKKKREKFNQINKEK